MFLEWENNSGKLQIISGKFQNNAINDVKQISLSDVIIEKNTLIVYNENCAYWSNFHAVSF